jgi:hypothetical protein
VDVHREQARGNALPIFFGGLVGLSQQGTRAMAIAEIRPGNATDCLKPWAIPDKWLEYNPNVSTWDPTDEFDRYYTNGPNKGSVLPVPDVYHPPGDADYTGFTIANDYGQQLTLKSGNPNQSIRPGWYFPVVLTGTGGSDYRYNIGHCVGVPYGVGDTLAVEPGNMIGPTAQGTQDLYDLDPNAYWDPNSGPDTDGDGLPNGQIANSCAGTNPSTCPGGFVYATSPRLVALPVFDVDVWQAGRTGGRIDIKVVNILGFFINNVVSNDVVGYLVNQPALYDSGRDDIPDEAAFSKVILLVR